MGQEQHLVFDEEHRAEYIFDRLVEKGIAVDRESIKTVLALEMEYMQSIGLVHELSPEQAEALQRELSIRAAATRLDTLRDLTTLFDKDTADWVRMGGATQDQGFIYTVISKLNAIDDVVERTRIGYSLFGTLYEDIG